MRPAALFHRGAGEGSRHPPPQPPCRSPAPTRPGSGAPTHPTRGGSRGGVCYAVFGKTAGFGEDLDRFTLNSATVFERSGGRTTGRGGPSLASVAVNGDGFADLIVGDQRVALASALETLP